MATEKSIKPSNLVPRSFGGEKNKFSDDLIANGYEVNMPQTYNGDNLNYQLDATGKELDYCEKVVDYINGLGVGKTPIVNANNKLDETQIGLKVYSATETYSLGEWVRSGDKIYQSLTQGNLGNDLTNETYWKEVRLGGGSGLELCDIGMALYVDETKGLRRYLNGQIVDINTNTQAFLNRLLEIKNTNPDYFATEDNWQAEALLNIDGCVYKFVLNYADDGGTVVSVRLPKYPDYIEINAGGTLPVYGNGMTLGLTNNTNNFALSSYSTNEVRLTYSGYGAYTGSIHTDYTSLTNEIAIGVTTDSTKSGIQTTLKQTKLKMRYFIQIATGSETENNIINDIELNNPFSLLDYKYSEYELNNLSWLRSNGQYNSKAVYPAVYDLLLKIYNGTETKAGVSVKLWTDESATDYDFRINTAEETFMFPTKVKLASGKAVVGNGMTLGLTDGTTNAGLGNISISSNVALRGDTDGYGMPVNTVVGSNDFPSDKSIGITTDPTKSGIETSDNGLYLYFYVGETVQNANLIDTGRIGEQLTNKADVDLNNLSSIGAEKFDGGWVVMPDYTPLVEKLNMNSTTYFTIDLSNFLPKDNNCYECYLSASVETGSTSGNYIYVSLATPQNPNNWFDLCMAQTRTSSKVQAKGTSILPVGTDRNIILYRDTKMNGTLWALKLNAYRRLGKTN